MSKGISKGTAVVLCVLSAATAFNASYLVMNRYYQNKLPDYEANNAIYGKLGEIRERVDDLYVGEYDVQDAVDMACVGFVTGVGDRWSSYMSKEEYESYTTSLEGQAFGIGVEIRKNSQVAIILLTVNNMEVGIVTGLEAGVNDYITKPFS